MNEEIPKEIYNLSRESHNLLSNLTLRDHLHGKCRHPFAKGLGFHEEAEEKIQFPPGILLMTPLWLLLPLTGFSSSFCYKMGKRQIFR